MSCDNRRRLNNVRVGGCIDPIKLMDLHRISERNSLKLVMTVKREK